jgi:hypothetical protein
MPQRNANSAKEGGTSTMRSVITLTALIGLCSHAIAADVDSEADTDAVDYYQDHAAQLKDKGIYDFESIGEAIALRKGYRGDQSNDYSVEFGTAIESLVNNPEQVQASSQPQTFDQQLAEISKGLDENQNIADRSSQDAKRAIREHGVQLKEQENNEGYLENVAHWYLKTRTGVPDSKKEVYIDRFANCIQVSTAHGWDLSWADSERTDDTPALRVSAFG